MQAPKARHLVISENVELLEMGVAVIQGLSKTLYADGHEGMTNCGVGRHFRHIIEFYVQFLEGLPSRIDYESRKRDVQVERDPASAIRAIQDLISGLESARADHTPSDVINVLTEILDEQGRPVETTSSIDRELSVLSSHTIHHYAIIALLLRGSQVTLPENFGVAPSTLRYRATREK